MPTPPNPITSTFSPRPGEIWALGPHRLLVGDCGDPQAIAALLQGQRADLLLTDPPYGVAVHRMHAHRLSYHRAGGKNAQQYHAHAHLPSDEDPFNAMETLRDGLHAAKPHLCPGSTFYIFMGDMRLYEALRVLRNAGYPHRQILVWVKEQATLTRSDYMRRHENVIYGHLPGARRYWSGARPDSTLGYPHAGPGSTKRELLAALERYQAMLNACTDVREVRKERTQAYHPTPKPLPLLEGFVERSCPPGGRVLDPFGGSCGTLLACQALGRTGYAAEVDPYFAGLALQRYRDAHPGATIARAE